MHSLLGNDKQRETTSQSRIKRQLEIGETAVTAQLDPATHYARNTFKWGWGRRSIHDMRNFSNDPSKQLPVGTRENAHRSVSQTF